MEDNELLLPPPRSTVLIITPAGYIHAITVYGADLSDLLAQVLALDDRLSAYGWPPLHRQAQQTNGDGNGPPCPVHGTPMRSSRRGGWYCPVKISDNPPTFCDQIA